MVDPVTLLEMVIYEGYVLQNSKPSQILSFICLTVMFTLVGSIIVVK